MRCDGGTLGFHLGWEDSATRDLGGYMSFFLLFFFLGFLNEFGGLEIV